MYWKNDMGSEMSLIQKDSSLILEEFCVWIALCGGLILGIRHIRTFMKCDWILE